MNKILTFIAICGLLASVAVSQTTTCDPTTCKATTTGTVKQQCCGSDGKCATDSAKCQTCGGIGIYCAGVKNPNSATCDAAKCQFGCCKSDGTCGAQSDCTGAGPCAPSNGTGAGCSTCCDSNKKCVFSNQTDTCRYCSNDLLVCSGASQSGDLKAGTCSSSQSCLYGCCDGKVCGTKEKCSPSTCDVDACNKTNGVRCCLKNKACAASQSECYYCENSLLCPGVAAESGTCDGTQCQFKCCDGTKCGTKEFCDSQNKGWLWWLIGGIVGGLLLLTLVVCYIRARRRRLAAAGQYGGATANPYPSGQYSYQAQR